MVRSLKPANGASGAAPRRRRARAAPVPERVRSVYERAPYPFGNDKALSRASWRLDLEWVSALAPDGFAPARVLMAGCGDGSEVFGLHRRLPAAQITGVDFSRRSIAVARRLRRRAPSPQRLRFRCDDLTAPGLAGRLGGPFDLITCHGVLAYVPDAGAALRNLAGCLAPRGVLYLGVNGATHPSTRLRPALAALGFDLEAFADTPRLRAALRAAVAVAPDDGLAPFATARRAFLATDVFGACHHALPWSRWAALARRAGLHYRGNVAGPARFGALPPVVPPLVGRGSRAELTGLLEALRPARFHRLLFARAPEAVPPWTAAALRRWRLRRSPLVRLRLPRCAGPVRDRCRAVRITSAVFGLNLGAQLPEWEIELLRAADGRRTVGELLGPLPLAIPAAELRRQLFLLYHLGVITLRPP